MYNETEKSLVMLMYSMLSKAEELTAYVGNVIPYYHDRSKEGFMMDLDPRVRSRDPKLLWV